MNKSKLKKRNRKEKVSDESIKVRWAQKRPVLLFVIGFVLFIVLFYMFWQSDFFNSKIQPIIISLNSVISSGLLNVLGQQTISSYEIISSSSISISIARGCDAVEAMALFLSTVLAFPMNLKKKIVGIMSGLILIFVINIIRIISLYFIGIYTPGIFETMHTQVWPVVIIIFATAVWIIIIRTEIKSPAYAEK